MVVGRCVDKLPGNPKFGLRRLAIPRKPPSPRRSEADKRDAERLATAHALAAIALQIRQSLWRSRRSGPLDHHGAHIQPSATRL
jgi:hypothetical protein